MSHRDKITISDAAQFWHQLRPSAASSKESLIIKSAAVEFITFFFSYFFFCLAEMRHNKTFFFVVWQESNFSLRTFKRLGCSRRASDSVLLDLPI